MCIKQFLVFDSERIVPLENLGEIVPTGVGIDPGTFRTTV